MIPTSNTLQIGTLPKSIISFSSMINMGQNGKLSSFKCQISKKLFIVQDTEQPEKSVLYSSQKLVKTNF